MVELRDNNPFRDAAFKSPATTTPPAASSSTMPSSNRQQPGRNPFLDQPEARSNQQQHRSTPSRGAVDTRKDQFIGPTNSRRRDPTMGGATTHAGGTRPSRSTRHEEKGTSARPGSGKQGHPAAASSSTTTHAERPRRPRSVSETSAQDLQKERAERDRRRGKASTMPMSSGSGVSKEKEKEKARRRKHLDKIDMLDVTGLSIAGGFHHDGPFDACNPSRNKNAKKAPVLAFAKDSTAMSMSAGPHVPPVYFGDHVNNAESFNDYGGTNGNTLATGKMRPAPALRSSSFDPTMKVDPIHGYETTGLGTSTFLEGAPASRAAMMARTNSETGHTNVDAGEGSGGRPRATSDHASGLGRKKSVIQRIRGAYKDRSRQEGGGGAGSSYAVSPGAQTPSDRAASSPPAYASVPGAQQTEYFDMKGPAATGSSTASPSHTGPPLRKIRSDLQDAPGYSDLEEEDEAAASTAHGSDPAATLSPLYRPASKTESNNGQAGTSLLGRVRSLRVGGAKRRE